MWWHLSNRNDSIASSLCHDSQRTENAEPDHWSQQPLRRAVGRLLVLQRCGCRRKRVGFAVKRQWRAARHGSSSPLAEKLMHTRIYILAAVIAVVFLFFVWGVMRLRRGSSQATEAIRRVRISGLPGLVDEGKDGTSRLTDIREVSPAYLHNPAAAAHSS